MGVASQLGSREISTFVPLAVHKLRKDCKLLAELEAVGLIFAIVSEFSNLVTGGTSS